MVYVDQLKRYETRNGMWCHMMSDSSDLEELREMGDRIGLSRSWLQLHPIHTHYDLVASYREKAIAAGAIEVSSDKMVRRCSLALRKKPLVVNLRRDARLVKKAKAAGNYVYIGRPSRGRAWEFGNPFSDSIKTKAAVVVDDPMAAHLAWLEGTDFLEVMPIERQWQLDNLESLSGKILGCFCKPKECHGDNLALLLLRLFEKIT